MGRYATEARRHADRIDHYHKHAGRLGYSQAEHHFHTLSGLVIRASRSKHDKNDVVIIQALCETAETQMQEMKQREGDPADNG